MMEKVKFVLKGQKILKKWNLDVIIGKRG